MQQWVFIVRITIPFLCIPILSAFGKNAVPNIGVRFAHAVFSLFGDNWSRVFHALTSVGAFFSFGGRKMEKERKNCVT